MGIVRIGISGWRYAGWRGTFYPKGLRQKDELAFAAERFHSIEINGTFYSLRRPENFSAWERQTPADFIFAVKAPRYLTHILRLRAAETALANFLASGVFMLGAKLGPILWQLPPSFSFDRSHLNDFLALLPHDTEAAAALARRHDRRLDGRVALDPGPRRSLRHAMEIRHDSFAAPEFADLLRAHGVALVCADSVRWPRLFTLTADFAYCRLHGSEELYASGYDDHALDQWAERVAGWARTGRDVFVYFDNDAKVRAPFDAQGLDRRVRSLLNLMPVLPA